MRQLPSCLGTSPRLPRVLVPGRNALEKPEARLGRRVQRGRARALGHLDLISSMEEVFAGRVVTAVSTTPQNSFWSQARRIGSRSRRRATASSRACTPSGESCTGTPPGPVAAAVGERRYFHEALPTAPIAQEMLDLVAELYIAEHAADAQGLVGAAKLEFRKQRAGPIRERMRQWLDAQRGRHPPKSPIAAAIRYADNQWDELGVFLDEARLPLDNNGSERALRRIALGRKNYLFVHDGDSGASIAGLYSLVATCEARQINPFEYLTDVLARVQDHPTSAIDELLPGAWAAGRDDV